METQTPNQVRASRLEEARALLAAGSDVPPELIADLVAEIDALRDQLSLSGTFEQGYINEIQRMNLLVKELADYVDTIADAVSDSLGTDEVTAQLKRHVVKLILESTQAVRAAAGH
ncbi:MAG: hypothetical protein ACSLFQ_07875 [Thermoanaerobaculia bacterium]